MDWNQVQAFFKDWGMYPCDEEPEDDLNPEVIEMGINRMCYNKLHTEALNIDPQFATFVSNQVEATDDAFYLEASTWDELEEAWHAHIDPSRP